MWRYWKITGDPVATRADDILAQAVRPVLASILEDTQTTQFHFLRYADPEFHLRLRVYCSNNALADRISADLTAALPRGVVAKQEEYHPETAKYGGRLGMALAEKWFTASSVLAFQVIDSIPDLPRRAAVGQAVLLTELTAISPDPAVQARCLGAYREIWTPYVTHRMPQRCEANTATEFDQAWVRSAAPFHSVLKQLEQDGALQCPKASVHLNMAHLFNNRCGLGPAWEIAQCDALLQRDLSDA